MREKNVLHTKVLVIQGSAFDQNYRKNEEYNNTEIIGRKKNTNMTRERRKREVTIIRWEL